MLVPELAAQDQLVAEGAAGAAREGGQPAAAQAVAELQTRLRARQEDVRAERPSPIFWSTRALTEAAKLSSAVKRSSVSLLNSAARIRLVPARSSHTGPVDRFALNPFTA